MVIFLLYSGVADVLFLLGQLGLALATIGLAFFPIPFTFNSLTIMAWTGNSTAVSTTEEFYQHWMAANVLLPPGADVEMAGPPLGFETDVVADTLESLLNDLLGQVTLVQSKANGASLARGELKTQQVALLDLFGQFADKVRGNLSGTKWVNALPLAPSEGDAQSRFCDPMDDAVDLWLRINTGEALGAGKVLVLRDGTTQALFATKVADIKTAWRALKVAELDLKLARGERNSTMAKIYPILRQYRVVLPTYFPAGSAIVESLPRLTPEPGSTPDPAVVSHVWNAGTEKVDISAQIPVQPNMKRARLLYSPGTSWSEEDASVVESVSLVGVDLEEPVVFSTNFALSGPGSHALFRVVVESETGNEASSNVIEVTRPA